MQANRARPSPSFRSPWSLSREAQRAAVAKISRGEVVDRLRARFVETFDRVPWTALGGGGCGVVFAAPGHPTESTAKFFRRKIFRTVIFTAAYRAFIISAWKKGKRIPTRRPPHRKLRHCVTAWQACGGVSFESSDLKRVENVRNRLHRAFGTSQNSSKRRRSGGDACGGRHPVFRVIHLLDLRVSSPSARGSGSAVAEICSTCRTLYTTDIDWSKAECSCRRAKLS